MRTTIISESAERAIQAEELAGSYLVDTEYSGHAKTGLDENASYHRMVFLDREKIFQMSDLLDLVGDLHSQFRESGQSRLVIRVLADPSITSQDLSAINGVMDRPEIDFYPDSEGRFNYLTVALNRADRAIENGEYEAIVLGVQDRVDRVNLGRASFEQEALRNLERATERGYRPTLEIGAEELTKIWEPFGWSRAAVENLLRVQSSDIVMGMRDRLGRLMAVALYNDQSHHGVRNGETTEWTTVPEFRGQGVIQPLLITLHGYLLSRGVENIWADLRTPDPVLRLPNSIEPGLRSGMTVFQSGEHRNISSNHVAIEGESQSYNAASAQVWGDLPHRQLRSFARGWVDGKRFTQRLIDQSLNNLNLSQ